MPEAYAQFIELVTIHPVLTSLLVAAIPAFIAYFVTPWLMLGRQLRQFSDQIAELRTDDLPDPIHIEPTDTRLKHLWAQYCLSLHQPDGGVNSKSYLCR